MGKLYALIAMLCWSVLTPSLQAAENDGGGKWFWEKAVGKISKFIDNVIVQIVELWESLRDLCVSIWNKLAGFFKGIVALIQKLWQWAKDTFTALLEWLGSTLQNFWNLFTNIVTKVLTWALDTLVYIGKTVVNFVYYFLDSVVGILFKMFTGLVDMLPKIELPAGFQTGYDHAIRYGMFLNDMFPVWHMCFLLGLYLTILIVVGVVRLIVKAIPFIG